MPTYEYKCSVCGNTFERFHSMTADPVKTCPDCGGEVRRLISGGVGIVLKGSNPDAGAAGGRPACGRAQTCCGRDTPCDHRPCES
ncbi:FmdB family zinc ribbon protein [Anaerobaca lacustris]|uniref:FmdB family zinc ribbon protein n=1 Tax=Anaerobaca lacustris TaxID=3044600 RepID=UPI0032BF8736